jgi:uncharacterized protein involved in exopolysaccharide biosynthesis
MALSDDDILSFQALYKSELGIEISREDAYEKGMKLLGLMSTIYKPMTEQEYDFIQRHRRMTKSLLEQYLNKP